MNGSYAGYLLVELSFDAIFWWDESVRKLRFSDLRRSAITMTEIDGERDRIRVH